MGDIRKSIKEEKQPFRLFFTELNFSGRFSKTDFFSAVFIRNRTKIWTLDANGLHTKLMLKTY